MAVKFSGYDYNGYGMKYDYHTHTIYSHGKGTIEENVIAARKLGLEAVAISDHGPGHLTYGMKRDKVSEMRKEIDRLNQKYQDIKIYLSVEANIINVGNFLDVPKDEIGQYDFILAGYHYGVFHGNCIKNFMNKHTGGGLFKNKLLVQNTDMAIKALYENDIKILTHPGDKAPFDILEVAKACAATDTLMEISTWHSHLTFDEIKIAMKTDAKFVVSSDAHSPMRIGDCAKGIKRAVEAGLEIERMVNIAKL